MSNNLDRVEKKPFTEEHTNSKDNQQPPIVGVETSSSNVLIEENGTILLDGIEVHVGLASQSSSLCNSVVSTTCLSHASSLISMKSTDTSNTTTSSSSATNSSSSDDLDQSSSDDHSGTRPILKQPQSASLLTRLTSPTILTHSSSINNNNNNTNSHSSSAPTTTKAPTTTSTTTSTSTTTTTPSTTTNVKKSKLKSKSSTTTAATTTGINFTVAGDNYHNNNSNKNEATTLASGRSSKRHHQRAALSGALLTHGHSLSSDSRLDHHNIDNGGGSVSHRIYQNSPFGLTRHYLSMPGGEDDQLSGLSRSQTEALTGEMMNNKDISTISGQLLLNDDLHQSVKQQQQQQQQQQSDPTLINGATTGSCTKQQQDKLMMLIPDSASQLAAKMKRASFGLLPDDDDDDENGGGGCNRRQKQAKHSIAGCSGKTSGSSSASCSKTEGGSDKKKHQQQVRSSTLLVKFCSIIYATFLIILGCILHIAELRQKSRNSSDHIYSSVVALIGILWLTFLHFDLQRYKNYACKFILIESIFNDHHQNDHDHQDLDHHRSQSSSRSLSGQSLDKMSMNTEVIFKKTAQHLSSQAAAIQAMRQANRRGRALSKAQIKRMSMNDIQQYEQQQVQQHQAYDNMMAADHTNSSSEQSSPNSVIKNNNSGNRKMSSAMLLQFQSPSANHHLMATNNNKSTAMSSASSIDDGVGISNANSSSSIHSHNHLLKQQPSPFDRQSMINNGDKMGPNGINTLNSGKTGTKSNINNNNYYHNDNQLIDDDLVPAYRFLHGKMGANFYLKCGMAAFCFGHVIHEGLRFGQQVYFFMTDNYPCQDVAALVAHLITPLYSFYQLFMMFKYSNLVINRFKTVAYFGLMHIIGTSITFWFRTILEEAFEDFVHKMDYFKATAPHTGASTIVSQTAGTANFMQNNKSSTSLMGASSGPILVSLLDMASSLLTQNDSAGHGNLKHSIVGNATHTNSQNGSSSSGLLSLLTAMQINVGQQGLASSKSNSFLDTTPSSLFGLASENNYLGSLLSSFYNDHTTSATSNLYPDSSIDETILSGHHLLDRPLGVVVVDGGHHNHHQHHRQHVIGDNTGTNNNNQGVISESIAQSLMTLMSSPVSATISPQLASHLPGSYACAQNTLLTTKSMNALPYLYPFTIEYNLLLAATFLGLYFNIGRLSSSGCSNHPFRRELVHNYENGKEELEYKSNFVVNADCHAANKGLFCGFFVLLVTLVSIVIFFVTINKPQHVQLGIKINLIQETTLTVLILLVTLAGFRQVVKLNRNACLKDKVTTDDVLMLVPLPFFFIHSLLSFRAEMASISSSKSSQQHQQQQNLTSGTMLPQNMTTRFNTTNTIASNLTTTLGNRLLNVSNSLISTTNHSQFSFASTTTGQQQQPFDYFKLITISLHVLVMIEVLVQTNFIIDGMRRCSQSRYLRFKKPGRELITFAILLNITYWIVATFESKSVEQYQTEIDFYGPLPWMFVSHTTLPVMLFYRYHSSVCLAEIWGRAYKPAKKVG